MSPIISECLTIKKNKNKNKRTTKRFYRSVKGFNKYISSMKSGLEQQKSVVATVCRILYTKIGKKRH